MQVEGHSKAEKASQDHPGGLQPFDHPGGLQPDHEHVETHAAETPHDVTTLFHLCLILGTGQEGHFQVVSHR